MIYDWNLLKILQHNQWVSGGEGVQVVCDQQSKFYQILDNIWLKSPETEIVDIVYISIVVSFNMTR